MPVNHVLLQGSLVGPGGQAVGADPCDWPHFDREGVSGTNLFSNGPGEEFLVSYLQLSCKFVTALKI